jgi:Tripartite tricarboxylate transporter TctB family
MGTAVRMGPGYIPFGLSLLLLGLGVLSCVRAFVVDGTRLEPWNLRPPIVISLSIAYFAFAIQSLGLVLTIFGLVVIGSFASSETRRWESIVLGVGLAFLSVLIFVQALRLPMQLWPAGWY